MMGMRRNKNGIAEEVDATKPCRCGTGLYCHRHLRYGTNESVVAKQLCKIRGSKARSKTGTRGESMGGEH